MTSTTPKARPIIFNAESVRAILAGRKTMTRRVVRIRPSSHRLPFPYANRLEDGTWEFSQKPTPMPVSAADAPGFRCLYGKVGDLLWVRERWCQGYEERRPNGEGRLIYAADGGHDITLVDGDGYAMFRKDGTERSAMRSPLFMPRWASRLTLRLKAVRVERLHAISEADAVAEGCIGSDPIGQFCERWEAINGKRPGCAWADCPWCWIVGFGVVNNEGSK